MQYFSLINSLPSTENSAASGMYGFIELGADFLFGHEERQYLETNFACLVLLLVISYLLDPVLCGWQALHHHLQASVS